MSFQVVILVAAVAAAAVYVGWYLVRSASKPDMCRGCPYRSGCIDPECCIKTEEGPRKDV